MKTKMNGYENDIGAAKTDKNAIEANATAVRQMASTLHLNDLLITYTPLMNKALDRICGFIFLNRSVRTSGKSVDLVIAQDA